MESNVKNIGRTQANHFIDLFFQIYVYSSSNPMEDSNLSTYFLNLASFWEGECNWGHNWHNDTYYLHSSPNQINTNHGEFILSSKCILTAWYTYRGANFLSSFHPVLISSQDMRAGMFCIFKNFVMLINGKRAGYDRSDIVAHLVLKDPANMREGRSTICILLLLLYHQLLTSTTNNWTKHNNINHHVSKG